jgi:hypothetical protein
MPFYLSIAFCYICNHLCVTIFLLWKHGKKELCYYIFKFATVKSLRWINILWHTSIDKNIQKRVWSLLFFPGLEPAIQIMNLLKDKNGIGSYPPLAPFKKVKNRLTNHQIRLLRDGRCIPTLSYPTCSFWENHAWTRNKNTDTNERNTWLLLRNHNFMGLKN